MRHRRLYRTPAGGRAPPRGAAPARVPRLRLRRDRRGQRPRPRDQEGGGQALGAGAGARSRHADRDRRHRAHPLGHPRRADHPNAHPHTDQSGRIAVIHNGIIENSAAIRKALEQRGHTFKSETDTEVLAHLVGEFYQGNLEEAVAAALRDVDGAYGLAFISADEPGVLVAARQGLAPAGGRGRERVVRRLGRLAVAAVHPLGGLPRRRRDGGAHPRRLPGAQPGDHPDQQAGQPDRLGPRDGGAGRLRPLHAEGDLRAAGEPLQHAPRPPAGGRRHGAGQRPQPERRPAQAGRADHHHRLRHLLALGAHRRVHAGGDGADTGGGGVRLRVPLPQSGGGRPHAGDRHLSVGRDRGHAGRDPRGQAPGRAHGRAGERRRLHHRARGGRRHLPARRSRGGRGEHQGVHQPGGGPGAGDAPHRPAPEPEHPAGPRVHPGACAGCRTRSRRSWRAARRSSSWPTGFSGPPPMRSTSAAG